MEVIGVGVGRKSLDKGPELEESGRTVGWLLPSAGSVARGWGRAPGGAGLIIPIDVASQSVS